MKRHIRENCCDISTGHYINLAVEFGVLYWQHGSKWSITLQFFFFVSELILLGFVCYSLDLSEDNRIFKASEDMEDAWDKNYHIFLK